MRLSHSRYVPGVSERDEYNDIVLQSTASECGR